MNRLIVLILLVACYCPAQGKLPAAPFPMAKGTTWIYEARVKYSKPNTTPASIGEKHLRWHMEVRDTLSGNGFQAALIKGAPWDLAWYEPGITNRGDYLIVTVGDTTYQLHDDQARATYNGLKVTGMTDDVRRTLAEHVWFRTPLRANATYCDVDQLEQPSGMYCWHVDTVTTANLAGVVGLGQAGRTAYIMAFRTNPDHEILTLAPSIGITAWEYGHHGTVSEAKLRLIEYRAGK